MKSIIKLLLLVFTLTSNNVTAQQKSLSLEDALAIGKENNKALQAKMLDTKSASEVTKIARSNMLPTVSASGSYSYYFDRQATFLPGAFTGNESEPVVDVAVGGKNAFNTYLSLNQPIVSEAARRQIKGARINEAIQDLQVKDERGNLTLDVTLTYYKTLLVRESIALNKQSLNRNQRSLEDSRSLLLQGKSLKIDTLRNFIVVENLKTTINYLENQHNVLLIQLRQLLGMNDETMLLLTDSLSYNNEERYFATVQTLYQEAVQNRPDLQTKKLEVELNKNYLSRSRAERLPTLALVGAYQIQAQSDDRSFASYRWPKTSFIGLQASVPIFAGNKANSRIRYSSIQLQKSQLLLDDATEKAKTEVVTLENNLKEIFQRLAIHERTVEAAEINYRIVNDRYRNGLSSRLELSDAELALTEAKTNQLNSVFNVKVAKLQLDKALGLLQY